MSARKSTACCWGYYLSFFFLRVPKTNLSFLIDPLDRPGDHGAEFQDHQHGDLLLGAHAATAGPARDLPGPAVPAAFSRARKQSPPRRFFWSGPRQAKGNREGLPSFWQMGSCEYVLKWGVGP